LRGAGGKIVNQAGDATRAQVSAAARYLDEWGENADGGEDAGGAAAGPSRDSAAAGIGYDRRKWLAGAAAATSPRSPALRGRAV
jgi:hypothetical protein